MTPQQHALSRIESWNRALVSWEIDGIVSLLQNAQDKETVRAAGVTRNRAQLEEALSEELRSVVDAFVEILDRARSVSNEDWPTQRASLRRDVERVLEPVRESFAFLHTAVVREHDLELPIERVRALEEILYWTVREARAIRPSG